MQLEAERLGDARADRLLGGRDVERHAAAHQAAAEPAEDEVGVRVGRLLAALAVGGGPGAEPADCGPLRSDPAASIVASDPPPAPMVRTSMLGKTIGWPYSTCHSLVVRSSPSWTSEMSVLVPPMSTPIALGCPQRLAVCWAATAPAAMPDAARRTASFCTASGVITPPPECRISRSPS